MKNSTIFTVKSELASMLEGTIDYLTDDIKAYKKQYADTEMPLYVVSEIEKYELKIKYLESLLKALSDLK